MHQSSKKRKVPAHIFEDAQHSLFLWKKGRKTSPIRDSADKHQPFLLIPRRALLGFPA